MIKEANVSDLSFKSKYNNISKEIIEYLKDHDACYLEFDLNRDADIYKRSLSRILIDYGIKVTKRDKRVYCYKVDKIENTSNR